jgi:hypothetical protein
VGEPPFSGDLPQLLEAHSSRPPERPSTKRTSVQISHELDDIILRLLAMNASERIQTGRELFLALERLGELEERSPSGRRTHPSLGNPGGAARRSARDRTLPRRPRPDMPAGGAAADQINSAGVFDRALRKVMCVLAHAIADLDDPPGAGPDRAVAPAPARRRSGLRRHTPARLRSAFRRPGERRADAPGLVAIRARRAALSPSAGARAVAGARPGHRRAHLDRRKAGGRLAERLEVELAPSTDQSIALAAERHGCEEELAAGYRALARLVDQ